MTEEEKRALAQQIFAQETARLSSHSPLDAAHADLASSLRRSESRKRTYNTLAKNGITWDDLRNAYHTAFKAGHDAMLTFKLSYFYAGSAIAFYERFPSPPETVATFIEQMVDIAEEYTDRATIVSHCLVETGIDTALFDENGTQAPSRALMTANSNATRKDREAVERMRRSGITQKDLEYEKSVGYSNGWNTGAGLSVCYGCAAIALHRYHSVSRVEIEQFIDRVRELEDEEISASDIISRALDETGVDVSEIAAGRKA